MKSWMWTVLGILAIVGGAVGLFQLLRNKEDEVPLNPVSSSLSPRQQLVQKTAQFMSKFHCETFDPKPLVGLAEDELKKSLKDYLTGPSFLVSADSPSLEIMAVKEITICNRPLLFSVDTRDESITDFLDAPAGKWRTDNSVYCMAEGEIWDKHRKYVATGSTDLPEWSADAPLTNGIAPERAWLANPRTLKFEELKPETLHCFKEANPPPEGVHEPASDTEIVD